MADNLGPNRSNNSNKRQEVIMTESKKTTDKSAEKKSYDWLSGNLLWGGLFMLAGLLLLLANLGVVSVAWGEIWKLWPLIIIIFGLSVLSLKGWVAGVVYGLSAVLILGLAWVALTGNLQSSHSGVVSDQFSVSRANDEVKSLGVNIKSGASSLEVASHSDDAMVSGTIESRLSDLKHESVVEGDKQTISLSQERNWRWLTPGSFNKLDVFLNQQIPTRLNIDAGASSIDADLSDVMLESVSVDSGASSIKLRLGDKHNDTDVEIDTGVSSVTIYVPESSGVKLLLDAGLSSKEVPSDFEKVDDETYQSPGYADATHKVNITVDMGVSSFKLLTY